MDATTRDLVRQRAGKRCEYCRLHEQHSGLKHHIEHITAKQHGGSDDADNLALACHRCNLLQGPNLTGIDPQTGQVASLFNPRCDRWSDHFAMEGARINGISAIGRATVQVSVASRANWIFRASPSRPRRPLTACAVFRKQYWVYARTAIPVLACHGVAERIASLTALMLRTPSFCSHSSSAWAPCLA
jgi:HNH endonuclease